jgi:hypothetical protein
MFVGGRGREYDGGLESVHVSVLGTIWGTTREGLGPAGWLVQRMSLPGVGSKIVMRETTDVTDWCWHDVGKIKK